MDVLADVLARARARGALFAHSALHAPWGLEFVDDATLSLHAVLQGELYVERDGRAPVRVLQGDVVLLHTDRPYRFLHAPGAPAIPLAEVLAQHRVSGSLSVALPGPGPRTELVCGAYALQGDVCHSLLEALPDLVQLPGAQADPTMRTALGLLVEELARAAPGQQTVLDRLLDLLVVFVLRTHFADPTSAAPPWYRAMDDPVVGPALAALHSRPSASWTVALLAAEVGLSRAAFARRFSAAVGQAPLAYLTRWRMGVAAEALSEPGATIAEVARQAGYANEFAFSAAFKRHHGLPPGRFRADQTSVGEQAL